MHLCVLSFNTLSLGACVEDNEGRGLDSVGLHQRPARAALLADQLRELSVSVAALQETRCPSGSTRIGSYLRYASEAESGQHGTELWFRANHSVLEATSQPSASAIFTAERLTVCHTDPRRMLVRFRQGRFAVLFCALHAPHRAHERDLIDSWWTKTLAILAKHRRRDPLIIAGDMNASVGSVTSSLVSDWAPETEDAAGAHLHALLKACECWLPCTFAEIQQGPTATYRQKRNLRWCRPDFVAIPSDWTTAVRAWTEPSVHVACSGIDHIATCVSAGPILALPGTSVPRARPRLDPQLFTDPARRDVILSALKSSPPLPWKVSAHAHAAIVVDHIQQSLAKICKCGKGRPTHVYLTDDTWQLQRRVSHLKRSLSTLQQRCKTSLSAFIFSAWRTPHLVSADPSPWCLGRSSTGDVGAPPLPHPGGQQTSETSVQTRSRCLRFELGRPTCHLSLQRGTCCLTQSAVS